MSLAWSPTVRVRRTQAVNKQPVGAHGRNQQGCAHMRIVAGYGVPCAEVVLPLRGPFRRLVVLGSIALGAADIARPSSASIV